MKPAATLTEAQLRRIVVDQANGITAAATAEALGLKLRKVQRVRGVTYKAAHLMRERLGLPPPGSWRTVNYWQGRGRR
jgi:hypothetical protein